MRHEKCLKPNMTKPKVFVWSLAMALLDVSGKPITPAARDVHKIISLGIPIQGHSKVFFEKIRRHAIYGLLSAEIYGVGVT